MPGSYVFEVLKFVAVHVIFEHPLLTPYLRSPSLQILAAKDRNGSHALFGSSDSRSRLVAIEILRGIPTTAAGLFVLLIVSSSTPP